MAYRITYGLVEIPASRFFNPIISSTRGHSLRYTAYCTPSSSRASDFGTSYQSPLSCQRPLTASRGVCQVFTDMYRTVFKDFNQHCFAVTCLRSPQPCTYFKYDNALWAVLYGKKKKKKKLSLRRQLMALSPKYNNLGLGRS